MSKYYIAYDRSKRVYNETVIAELITDAKDGFGEHQKDLLKIILLEIRLATFESPTVKEYLLTAIEKSIAGQDLARAFLQKSKTSGGQKSIRTAQRDYDIAEFIFIRSAKIQTHLPRLMVTEATILAAEKFDVGYDTAHKAYKTWLSELKSDFQFLLKNKKGEQ